jgi:hypothetical protein
MRDDWESTRKEEDEKIDNDLGRVNKTYLF